jgi:putative endonuclease
MTNAYRVYVLQNREGRFYIGVTANVAHRLAEHNAGRSRWTKGKGPWHHVWESEMLPLSAACKLENHLKRQGRGSGFYTMTGLTRRPGS